MDAETLPLPRKRYQPKLAVVQLAELLSGERKCEWPTLVAAQYDLPKEPVTDELAEWRVKHDRLVTERVAELERNGLHVQVENENWLSLVGQSGLKLSGKPDIVILERERVTYEDCKSGKPKGAHHIQVLLYAQLARQTGITAPLAGNVIYPNGIEPVDLVGRRREVREKFIAVMARVNSGDVPRIPSWSDCRYCKVRAYCPDRIENEPSYSDALGDVRR